MLDETRMTIRLPGPVAGWLRDAKEREGSTVNFEIIRSIRERMDREAAGISPEKASPAASNPIGASTPVSSTHG